MKYIMIVCTATVVYAGFDKVFGDAGGYEMVETALDMVANLPW